MLEEKLSIDLHKVCVGQTVQHDEVVAYIKMPEGYGNCYFCKYDPVNNPRCKGYNPCTVFYLKVER